MQPCEHSGSPRGGSGGHPGSREGGEGCLHVVLTKAFGSSVPSAWRLPALQPHGGYWHYSPSNLLGDSPAPGSWPVVSSSKYFRAATELNSSLGILLLWVALPGWAVSTYSSAFWFKKNLEAQWGQYASPVGRGWGDSRADQELGIWRLGCHPCSLAPRPQINTHHSSWPPPSPL